MNCHYSCAACSANIYYDLCTACPSTRSLVSSLCACQDGYYEVQQPQCQLAADTSIFDSILITTSQIAFYVGMGFHLLVLVLALNRLISVKIKKIIDTLQVVGLISSYRYLQDQVSSKALKAINAFNFDYLTTLSCDWQTPEYGCIAFQNLIGPGFTLLLFLGLFLVSYCLATCIHYANSDEENVVYIRNGKEEKSKSIDLSLRVYWQATRTSFFLLYLDQTAIQTVLSVSRVAITNYWGVLVAVPFLVLVVAVGRLHFRTINDPRQTTLLYRTRHPYFFIYDNQYHLNYIDHLFQSDNLKKDKLTLKRPFYPESNLLIIELLFKILLAVSTVVFYQYQPYLFVYFCIFLLLIFICSMDRLFHYERSNFFFYLLCVAAHAYAVAVFYIPSLFSYFIAFLPLAAIVVIIVALLWAIAEWKGSREGEMVNKIYQIEQEEVETHNQVMNQSQEEIKINQSEEDKGTATPLQDKEQNLRVSPAEHQSRITRNRTFNLRQTNINRPEVSTPTPINPNITNGHISRVSKPKSKPSSRPLEGQRKPDKTVRGREAGKQGDTLKSIREEKDSQRPQNQFKFTAKQNLSSKNIFALENN